MSAHRSDEWLGNPDLRADAALDEMFLRHRERLQRLAELRLDPRLRGRLDASDVVQEVFLEASERYDAYRRDPAMPAFLWLRFLTIQRLALLHRTHLGVQGRDAGREVALPAASGPAADAGALAERLVGHLTSPSRAAIRDEQIARLRAALGAMDPIDREVLALRHFEQLSNVEAAQVLGLRETAASNRYVRALRRLRAILDAAGEASG